MAFRLTLQQLRDEVGNAADVTISASGRYSNSMADRWINQAIQEVQMLRIKYGSADEAKASAAVTATDVAQTGGYLQREVAALPADFMGLKSVYLNYGSIPQRFQLLPMTESDEEDMWENGRPRYYTILDAGQSGTARLRLWPPADQDYTLQILYYPEHPTLTLTTDLWEYAPGTQDLVICKAALNLVGRDGMQEVEQMTANQMRYASALDALKQYCARDPGLKRMRNTRDNRTIRLNRRLQ